MHHPCVRNVMWASAAAGMLVTSPQAASAGQLVNYTVAATGQTATADFSFAGPDTLLILLTETTPGADSPLTGGAAVLTALGFHLPAGQVTGGTVQIGLGSASVGFGGVNPQLVAGDDVSTEWGYSQSSLAEALRAQGRALESLSDKFDADAAELDAQAAQKRARAKAQRDAAAQLLANNPDAQMRADAADLIKAAEQDEKDEAELESQADAARDKADELEDQANVLFAKADASPTGPYFQLVGVLDALPNPFLAVPPGTNLDGPDGLDGPQGGLLGDIAARNGLGVIASSVAIALNLSTALDADQQAAFLRSAPIDSFVEYGEEAAFAALSAAVPNAVPEPGSLVLLASCIPAALAFIRRRRARMSPTRG